MKKEVLENVIVKQHKIILDQCLHFGNNVKTPVKIRDKNDKIKELTDNFEQNYRLTESNKEVRIITSS